MSDQSPPPERWKDRGVQARVLLEVSNSGLHGRTVAELRTMMPEHHGTVSGALSNLHERQSLACLRERRGGCFIYVLPLHIEDRPTRRYGDRKGWS